MTTITRKTGRDLKIGDTITVAGQEREITSFEPHPGLDVAGDHHTARIANYTLNNRESGVTIFDDEDFVEDNGTHFYRHHWNGQGN